MIKWIYLQLILLSSQWARGIKTSQRVYGIKPLEPERGIKYPKPSVFGFASNTTLRGLKCRRQKKHKRAPSSRKHTRVFFSFSFFHSGAFWPKRQIRDNSIKEREKKKEKTSDSSDSRCVWWKLLFATSPTSILSTSSYIKLALQSVNRRLFHLPEVGLGDEILG